MKIHLVTYTPEPAKAIAAAFWNTGIGHDVKSLSEISDEKAADALNEMFKSHLDGALEFASFNFFWEDIPIFMRSHLVRHRVGWGFAERSLRYYDAAMEDEVANYDWEAMPTVTDKIAMRTYLSGRSLKGLMAGEMKRQVQFYDMLLKEGVDQQDARNVLGVWYPTNMQTTCTYRALRTMLASRLTSQAHPFWQKAAREIKALVTEVSPVLGAGLVDVCQIAGRCVWHSRFDRDCDDCIKRGKAVAHEHQWTRTTSRGEFTQCDCGMLKPLLLT